MADTLVPASSAIADEPSFPSPRAALRACGFVAIMARLLAEHRVRPGATTADMARRAQRTARAILALHGVEVVSSGSPPAGPAVIAANHLSYLDPLVVSSVAPCVSIAKGETVEWPLIGRGLCALGVIFVQRSSVNSGAVTLRRALRALRGGASVLNFPEGTTSDGRDVASFRRGVFGLGRLAGTPIVPTRIRFDDAGVAWYGGETFLPHYWRVARAPRVVARVAFGEPILPRPSDDPADLAARTRDVVAGL
jgi:1-acyl-sn-glycerol-3-phosphate acyltransferase